LLRDHQLQVFLNIENILNLFSDNKKRRPLR